MADDSPKPYRVCGSPFLKAVDSEVNCSQARLPHVPPCSSGTNSLAPDVYTIEQLSAAPYLSFQV
eukprot:scaffold3697_cov390-Prasinococcus_capsulatus_cf.AAC.12